VSQAVEATWNAAPAAAAAAAAAKAPPQPAAQRQSGMGDTPTAQQQWNREKESRVALAYHLYDGAGVAEKRVEAVVATGAGNAQGGAHDAPQLATCAPRNRGEGTRPRVKEINKLKWSVTTQERPTVM